MRAFILTVFLLMTATANGTIVYGPQNFTYTIGTNITANPPNFNAWDKFGNPFAWNVYQISSVKTAGLQTTGAGWYFGLFAGGTFTYTDYTATIRVDPGSAPNDTGIVFDATYYSNSDWPDGYSFDYSDSTDLRVIKYTKAGGPAVIASGQSGNFVDGTVLEVISNGSGSIVCKENGVTKYTITDTSFESGTIGMISRDTGNTARNGWTGMTVDNGTIGPSPTSSPTVSPTMTATPPPPDRRGQETFENRIFLGPHGISGTQWGAYSVAQNAAAQASWQAYTYSCPQGTYRVANYGHSIAAGWSCTGSYNDGYRPALLLGLANLGVQVNFVGTYTRGSVIACDNTDGIGGLQVSEMYPTLLTLPTVLPTPTSHDWVLIGPTLTNDATVGHSLAQMYDGMVACITRTVSLCAPCKIYVVNDVVRNDGTDISNCILAAHEAFTWAQGQGYNVREVNLNACSSIADLCGDGIHLSPAGNAAVGPCMAQDIVNAH